MSALSPEFLAEAIRLTMPRCRAPETWGKALYHAFERYRIAELDAIAVFLAQIAVESAETNVLEENLSYSADRLMQVWPRRFPTYEVAIQYSNSPRRLANYVYSNRMGNGPPETDDGWRFRGRGLKMITGRDNYATFADDTYEPVIAYPDLLKEPRVAALSAAHFWVTHPRDLTAIARDLPGDDDEEDFKTITKAINGGTIGLAQRRGYWTRAKLALGLP